MSVITAAIVDNQVSISCDSLFSSGSMGLNSKNLDNKSKLIEFQDAYFGLVGWTCMSDILTAILDRHMVEIILEHSEDTISPSNIKTQEQMFIMVLAIHAKMKEHYFIHTNDGHFEDQPVESSQLDFIMINRHGIFSCESFRSVLKHSKFHAIGSGQQFAMGAMHSYFNDRDSALVGGDLVERGVLAACEFDNGCALPLITHTLRLKE